MTQDPDTKCAIAERYIRTCKNRLWKYFSRVGHNRYVDFLQKLVSAINRSVSRSTGMRPVDVNLKNENQVWERLYGKPSMTKTNFRFNVGDNVRILEEKQLIRKGYRPTFTDQTYHIRERIGRQKPAATYHLETAESKTPVLGIFYEPEMIRVATESESLKTVKKFIKADNSTGELRHWVSWNDKSENSWISDRELVIPSEI